MAFSTVPDELMFYSEATQESLVTAFYWNSISHTPIEWPVQLCIQHWRAAFAHSSKLFSIFLLTNCKGTIWQDFTGWFGVWWKCLKFIHRLPFIHGPVSQQPRTQLVAFECSFSVLVFSGCYDKMPGDNSLRRKSLFWFTI